MTGWILLVRGEGGGMGRVGFDVDQLLVVALIGFAIGGAWTISGQRRAAEHTHDHSTGMRRSA